MVPAAVNEECRDTLVINVARLKRKGRVHTKSLGEVRFGDSGERRSRCVERPAANI